MLETLTVSNVMTNVSDIAQSNVKAQKRQRNATLQIRSKRRKKLENEEIDEKSTFDGKFVTLFQLLHYIDYHSYCLSLLS